MSGTEAAGRAVVLNGVGYRLPAAGTRPGNVFEPPAKANLAAWAALSCARQGLSTILVGRAGEKLTYVRDSIAALVPSASVTSEVADLLDPACISGLVSRLPSGVAYDVVHSVGLSAGSYTIPDDNPYLPVDDTPDDLPVCEFNAVVTSLLGVVKAFLPRWRAQPNGARLVVIASMSGIRAYPMGYAHASAKGGLHNAVRSLALELVSSSIYVSEVNPGIIDTGMYDSPAVQRAVTTIGRQFGHDYSESGVPMAPPSAVGDAVALCLQSPAHVLTVDVVARGQFPHTGA